MRSITGCGVLGSTSVELARSRPHTWRANSMTAICMPKQMPRKGMLFSRAWRTAWIFPSVPRDPGAHGLRPARHRGGDPGGAPRAREQHPLPRHLLRHADGRHRVRAPRVRPRARQHDRGGSQHAASGDRSHGHAARPHAEGRDDAPGSLSRRARGRLAGAQALQSPEDLRAPPPPLRGEQRLSRAAREGRARALRRLPRRHAGRDDRTPRPSLVRREPVSPRAQVAADGVPPALQGLHQGGPPGPRPPARGAAARRLEGGEALVARGVRVGTVTVGGGAPLALIAGPCVIESRDAALRHAERVREIAARAGMPVIYKSSFDKANRTSLDGFRGMGMEEGLAVLAEVRRETGLAVLTDVHEKEQVAAVAAVVDVLQTPAFLCRQTDFIVAVAAAGKPVNLKKGQFLSPGEMERVVEKARSTGNQDLLVTERGFAFGYNNLVADLRSLPILAATGCPVVFDATHSVQQPGGMGTSSGGQSQYVPVLARAAVAAGVAGVFMETHPDPSTALSDGPNMWPLARMEELLTTLIQIDAVVKQTPFAEDVEK